MVDALRPTRAEIDLAALAHNVQELRRCTRPQAQLMAVVKADGYGHGAVPVARCALAAGATWLGVAVVEEAMALRQAGLTAPILVLGWVPPEQVGLAVAHDLQIACYDLDVARALAAAGGGSVHVKVDTGMGRLGIRPEEVLEFVRALPDGVQPDGIFTHFARADDPASGHTEMQLATFRGVLATLAAAGVCPRWRHAANSAGIMLYPESHYDLVRMGIAMYGLAPDPALDWPAELRPALSLKSRISHLKEMRPGEVVSYGSTWTARGGERVATIPVGYADGYRRLFTNQGQVLVGGQRCRVVGRVCMDQTMVWLPADVPAAVGDAVVLLGRQGDGAITADDWAGALDTINYEIVCLIGSRVARVYPRPQG